MRDEYDTLDEASNRSRFAPARFRAHRLAEHPPSTNPDRQPRPADAGMGLTLRLLDDFVVPPSLEPTVMPDPLSPPRRGTTLRALARVFAVGLIAAGGAVMIVMRAEDESKPIATPAAMKQVAAASVRPEATARGPVPELPETVVETPRMDTPAQAQPASESPSAGGGRSEPDPVLLSAAIPSSGGVSADADAADQRQAVRRLDSADVAALLQRGHEVAGKGDLVGARLLFQRAAEAGDSEAALALAGTYDPIVLEHLGERGLASDVAAARFWYQKAQELGSKEAPQRLEMLASRTN